MANTPTPNDQERMIMAPETGEKYTSSGQALPEIGMPKGNVVDEMGDIGRLALETIEIGDETIRIGNILDDENGQAVAVALAVLPMA